MVSFETSQFNRIFPFYFLLNHDLVIESNGVTLEKLFPGIKGKTFAENFILIRPELSQVDFNSLELLVNQLVIIGCRNQQKTTLRGQLEFLPGENQLLFIGSPWFGSMNQVIQNNLSIDDFALHDPMIDLLHVLKSQEITTEDLKKLLQTINKQKNELKNASKEIYDIALFAMQNPDPLIRIDFQGNVLKINPVAEKISEFTYNNENYTTPDFWRKIASLVDPAAERETIEAKSAGRWFSFVIKPLPEEGYFNIYGRDVTEQKENEEQLLILSSIAADNTHGVVIADKEGKIEWVNRSFEKMTGYTINEIKGKKPGQLLQGKETSIETSTYLRNQVYIAEPFVCEILNYNKSGHPYWSRIRGQALKDNDGNVIKYFSIEEDITELKKNQLEIERLSLVVKSNLKGVHFTGPDFKINYVNESLLKLTGYELNEVIGKTLPEIVYGPLTQAESIKELELGHLEVKPVDVDIILYRKNKTWFWANVKKQPIEKNNNLQEYFSIIEDISEKKEAEETLRNSKIRLAELIKSLDEGILLEDENRSIVLTNTNFCSMFGIPASPEDLTGADCSGSAEQSKFMFRNPDEFVRRIEQTLSDRKTILKEELELVSGHYFERDYIPISIDGIYKGHLWKYSDITERKSQENSLKKQEEKFRNIIANMKMGLLETDNEDVIMDVNQQFCEMSGYSREELIGMKSVDLLVGDGFKSEAREKSSSRLKGASSTYPLQVKLKNGDLRWWLTSGGPNFNDKGKLIGTVGISVDVTDQKKLEHELEIALLKAEESSVAKEAFLANMSHEIRTPLNAIIGIIREFSREVLSPKQSMYIKNATLASQHLLSTLNNILDISKIESGQLALVNRPFNLHEVVVEAISILAPSAQEKMLKISERISQRLAPAYMGDSSRIRQVLLNVINNAIKFTETGSISVECMLSGEKNNIHTIQLKVSDTGIGMDEAFVKTIFEKFSQDDYSAVRKYGGTGLGMAIVSELIHMMDGTVKVSTSKGVGTTIEINLELELADETEIETKPTPESYNSLKNKKILLVEDNDLNRLVAENLLSFFGMKVTEAVNGIEAIEKLKQSAFDLILMDLQMPEMGGLEAAALIRNQMQLNTPIIALTANAFKEELQRCMLAGMNDYITKPYEENVLLEAMLKCLPLGNDNVVTVDVQPETEKKLYNLEYLSQFNRGNADFIRKMINGFVELARFTVEQIEAAFATGDFDTIKKLAHRIKPNIDMFGIEELKQEIRSIESIAGKSGSDSELEGLISKLHHVINIVVKQLEEENF